VFVYEMYTTSITIFSITLKNIITELILTDATNSLVHNLKKLLCNVASTLEI